VGSAGNAVAVASFHDKLACESARGAILIADDKYIGRAPVMVCVPQ
jgi:hypothetical protein